MAKPIAAAAPKDGCPPVGTLDQGTAAICGYPEEDGEAKIKITATNAKGTDIKTLTLTIGKPAPLQVTGGTVSEYADAAGVRWTVLTFTNNGSFTVSGGPAEYLIVAGGGGGGPSGGGGAGGMGTGSVSMISGEHKVVVGTGGGGVVVQGGVATNGEPSSIVGPAICWTASGGGKGGDWAVNGGAGGSGGGAGKASAKGGNALPPATVASRQDATLKQGYKGGDSNGDTYRGAGGGNGGSGIVIVRFVRNGQ